MSIFDEPKIDCHCHIFDPARFPYARDNPYHPAGQEIAPAAQIGHLFAAGGVRNAVLVQPNSGYGEDNSCMLAAIAESAGRFKGVAVVPNDAGSDQLAALKAQGIVGVAFNLPFHGLAHYLDTAALIERLRELDMFLQLQFHEAQLLDFLPLIKKTKTRLLIDHCGRPTPDAGIDDPAFQALLRLGREGRASVKLSGLGKFSNEAYPYRDAWPYLDALVQAFTLDACMWGSDWPFLRARSRIDYGPLLTLFAELFPDADDRRKLFWDTPRRLFGFA